MGDETERERELLDLIDELTAEVHRLQTSDPLTGVLNRQGFLRSAEQLAAVARRAGRESVLLVVDLHGLRDINEALGQDEGDALIRDSAVLLERTLRDVDIVGRWAGTELVVLMPDCAEPQVACRRLVDAAAAWSRVPQISFEVAAVTIEPADERGVEVVLAEVTGGH